MAVKFMGRLVKGATGRMGIVPDTALDNEALEAIKTKGVVRCEVVVPRNPKFHRKMFALFSVIFDCMSEETKQELNVWTAEELRNRVKIDTGRYTLWIVGANATLPEGTPVYIPDSMSYDSMDDSEFETLFNQTIMIAISKYITGQDVDSVNAMVDEVLRFGERGRA